MIPTTRLNIAHSIDRIRRNVVQLHEDMRSNAQAHKAAAEAGSPAVALRGNVLACVTAYRGRLQWISNIVADPARRQHMQAQLARLGWDEGDVTQVSDALGAAVETLAGAPLDTAEEIAAACAALLAEVAPLESDPETVWPE